MLSPDTLTQLRDLLPLEEFVDIVSMQAILHTTKPKVQELTGKNSFGERCQQKFAERLLGSTPATAELAMARLLAAGDYENSVSLQGLGGCVVTPLKELIRVAGQEHVEPEASLSSQPATDGARRPRMR